LQVAVELEELGEVLGEELPERALLLLGDVARTSELLLLGALTGDGELVGL
jgi:hypothetical protein